MSLTIAPVAKSDEPLLGYRPVRMIGQGGCGEVWRALSPGGKSVALKFLACDSEHAVTRELRGLQSILQLKHPHLIKTHAIWAESRRVTVAMELAEGSLLDLLQVSQESAGEPLPPEHVCYYLRQAARALDFLNTRQHQLGGRCVAVRHCDVKPSNLLLFSTTVKLADFSFSVSTSASMGEYERVGTLHYAAPEIFQGWLSATTDQFALAVTYHELRTGHYPFPEPPTTFERNYVRPAPDLSLLTRAEIPILKRALHAIPQNRWPSCIEFIDRLQKAVKIEDGD